MADLGVAFAEHDIHAGNRCLGITGEDPVQHFAFAFIGVGHGFHCLWLVLSRLFVVFDQLENWLAVDHGVLTQDRNRRHGHQVPVDQVGPDTVVVARQIVLGGAPLQGLVIGHAQHFTGIAWPVGFAAGHRHLRRVGAADQRKAARLGLDVVIQINGKKRAIINAINNESEENIFSKSLAIKNIKVILEKTTITKKIFVKNKLLNIVTNEK